jgi:long-chain acyl-CoA synthetase
VHEAYLVDELLQRQTLDDTALLIYTSGSTGKPKGAMISYGNVAAMAHAGVDCLGLAPDNSHLSYLPLCHVAEQMLTVFIPLYLGSRVDFGESIRTVQEDLREVAPRMFLGVPRIWEKLAAAITIKMQETGALRRALYARAMQACEPFAEVHPTRRSLGQRLVFGFWYLLVFRALQNFIGLRSTRVALTGAAPISPAVVRYFRTLGVPLLEVYGMTETSGMVLGQRPDVLLPGSVGTPVLGAEMRVSDLGELQLRGPMIFQGYYKNPEATAGAVADARRFVAALVQIDFETVSQWAQAQGLVFTHFRSLTELPRVRELVQREIDAGNAHLAQVAQVRKFHLLTKELDHDDGEVTATMKVRRASVYKTYATEIEALYG